MVNDADQSAPEAAQRSWKINEDWTSVIVGLALLLLILAGVIVDAWVP